eukprot:TRINITY_DN1852_c0_g2_i2.p1 TRINITY_DN1852_c0_g2~~TRINITY_DN1852_c0_g2_i2.p1  ORF type:complete len:282 (+),score=45.86 TRINITY_DN1852_c0_g2_i2:219-1064(+)
MATAPPNSGLLKRVTMVLCSLNVIVALYLVSMLLTPATYAPAGDTHQNDDAGKAKGRVVRLPSSSLHGRRAGEERTTLEEEAAITDNSNAEEAKGTEAVSEEKTDAFEELKGLEDPTKDVTKEGEAAEASTEDLMRSVQEATEAKADTSGDLLLGIPSECHADAHMDYDGDAVVWGLTHLKDTAADCCAACQKQAADEPETHRKCNTWVYCPEPDGCFSPDIYDHKHRECWLKYSVVPKVNFQGRYSAVFRGIHPTSPEFVQWMAGRTDGLRADPALNPEI